MNKKIINNPDKTYIFMDLEFDREDLISIGIIQVNENFEIIKSFHSYIKPLNFDKLNEHVKKITNIQNKDINSAPDINIILPKILNDLKYSSCRYVYVYGYMDKNILLSNLEKIEKSNLYIDCLDKIIDLQPVLNKQLPLLTEGSWGLKQLCKYYNIKEPKHNALSDAKTLMQIVKKYNEGFRNTYYYNRLKKTAISNNVYKL